MSTPKKIKGLSKEETEVLEMVRLISHVPLNQIHEVMKALGTVASLKYAEALQTKEDEQSNEIVLLLPYIGSLSLRRDRLLLDMNESRPSFFLNELIDVKRAVEQENDSQFLDTWYNRVVEDLQEQL